MVRTPFAFLLALPACAAGLFQVGRGVADITPEPGTPMAGYYSIRLATGTHDPLQAKAIVMALGGEGARTMKAALVACDLVAMPPHVVEEARKLIEKATGIRASAIMISATHSHTGPVLTGRGARDARYGGDMPVVKRYMDALPGRIAEAVRRANENLKPAKAWSAVGREDSIAFNRRFHMKDGTVGWNPGKLNPNIVRPAGPIDPDVNVVYFAEEESGKPIATYVNYAMHLDTVGGTEWSADYPYALGALLEKAKGAGMMTMFTIGTAGNINHVDVSHKRPQKGHEEAARLGTALAGAVEKAYGKLSAVGDDRLHSASRVFQIDPAPVTKEELERARAIEARVGAAQDPPKFLDTVFAFKAIDAATRKGEPYDVEVQAIALGKDVVWVALPGEVFVELGLAIRKASPFRHTIVVELAHGPTTYIPNEAAFAQGNYEVVSSRLAKGAGENLVETAIEMLKEMHAR